MRRVISEKPVETAPFFSIVIPTRNEAEDILVTLRSIRDNDDKDFEVLVVDASSDDTPRMVQDFSDPRFRLLPQDNRDGRCGARNQGIRAARGEVVVILNADVRLPSDFLSRARKHYEAGGDYLIVDSRVENVAHPFGAMVEAEHRHLYRSGREAVNWCEGYSCRRRCAMEAGLFPEKYSVPICAGEDAVFGENMAKRFRRAEDMSLVVPHVVPEDLRAFWAQRVGRGEGCAQRRILLDGWPLSKAIGDGFLWGIKTLLWLLLLMPWIWYAAVLRRRLPEASLTGLLWAVLLSRAGHEVGRWKGIVHLAKKRSGGTTAKVFSTTAWMFLAGLILLHLGLGWDRWGDLNWDSARELMTPRRLLAGDRPWRDFEMIYGPLSYFANAAVMAIFSESLWVDRTILAVLIVGTGFCLAQVGHRVLPPSVRPWMLVAWVGIFVFPPSFASMTALMLPYSTCGPWSEFWLGATMLFGGHHLATGSRRSWWGVSAIASLAPYLCKVEATVAIELGVACLLVWTTRVRRKERFLILAGTFSAIFVILLTAATTWVSPSQLWERVVASVRSQGQGNAGEFPLKATIRLAAFYVVVGALARWGEAQGWRRHSRRYGAVAALILLGSGFAVCAFWLRETLLIQACLTLLMAPWIGLGLWILDRFRAEAPPCAREIPWYHLVGIFASIRFAVDGHVYPFMFMAVALLPATFLSGRRLVLEGLRTRWMRLVIVIPFLLGGAALAADSLAKYARPWIAMETPYGRIRYACRTPAHMAQARLWQEAARWIRDQRNVVGGRYLVSLSPGYMMSLLTGLLPPQYTLNSGLLAVKFDGGRLRSPLEEREIIAIRNHPAEFAVLDNTPIWASTLGATRALLHEGKIPGALFFGEHYLPALHAFIMENYEPTIEFRTRETEGANPYQLTVLRRKHAASVPPKS